VSDKISPVAVVKEVFILLYDRKGVFSFLFILFAIYFGIEALVRAWNPAIEVDPFSKILFGYPLLIIFSPIAIMSLWQGLCESEESTIIPASFCKKIIKFSAFLLLFTVIIDLARTIALFMTVLALATVAQLFSPSGMNDQVTNWIGRTTEFLTLTTIYWQLLKRILIFPSIVAENSSLRRKPSLLLKGNFFRFITSFCLLYTPLILLMLPFEFLDEELLNVKRGESFSISYLMLSACFSSIYGLLGTLGLSRWYEKLRLRYEPNQATTAPDYGQCQD